jgi:hypothetical protein
MRKEVLLPGPGVDRTPVGHIQKIMDVDLEKLSKAASNQEISPIISIKEEQPCLRIAYPVVSF